MMKEKITEESIKSLRQDGLRFSVDVLAEKLHISKKTIYKYFPSKEALAHAIYEKYYKDTYGKINDLISQNAPDNDKSLLMLYFDSAKMVHKDIFNKFRLNNLIEARAVSGHSRLWELIKPYICREMSDYEAEIYKMIVDASFCEAISQGTDPSVITDMLSPVC